MAAAVVLGRGRERVGWAEPVGWNGLFGLGRPEVEAELMAGHGPEVAGLEVGWQAVTEGGSLDPGRRAGRRAPRVRPWGARPLRKAPEA